MLVPIPVRMPLPELSRGSPVCQLHSAGSPMLCKLVFLCWLSSSETLDSTGRALSADDQNIRLIFSFGSNTQLLGAEGNRVSSAVSTVRNAVLGSSEAQERPCKARTAAKDALRAGSELTLK